MEKLNKPKLFEILKQNLPKKYSSDLNIIEFKDGIIYAWNAADSSILTHNIEFQLKHSKEYPIQVCVFDIISSNPVYRIENIIKLPLYLLYCRLYGLQMRQFSKSKACC